MTTGTLNKWAGSFLSAALVLFALRVIVQETTEPKPPAKPGFEVAETKDQTAPAGGAAAPAAPAAPAADPPIAEAMKKADADAGKQLTNVCQSCHSFDKTPAAGKAGPPLYGVVGRKVASVDGYSYSPAMQAKGGTWGYEDLYKFLASPKTVVPGTKMGFQGYPEADKRANVIAYLRTLSDSPLPLPQ